MSDTLALDGVEYEHYDGLQTWMRSWHSGPTEPDGKRHGSGAICLTPNGEVVLVTEDGTDWVLPAGRPEGNESWRETLDREVMEEACAKVEHATLLGYLRNRCIQGHEKGLVLVRSIWRAEVTLQPWDPTFEIVQRRLLSQDDARKYLLERYGPPEVIERLLREAGI